MNFFKKALIILFLFPCASLMAQTRVACMLGDTLALNLSGTRGDLQWQVSNDSLNWTDIPGQQSGQLEFISSLPAQWVRAGIRENNCPVFYENPILIEATDTTLPGVDANIIVMDTVLAQFTPDSAQQEIGIYQYNANTEDVSFKPGDILLGTDGEGYLRFVDDYIIQNGILTIHTHQATLDDLFDDESFSFDLLTDSVESRTSGFNYDFSQTVLYDAGGVTLSIESGTIGMSGDWRGDLEYSLLGGLKNFYFGTNNLNLNTNFDLKLVAASSAELINGTKQLAKFSKTIRVLVAGLPVMVTLYADLKAKYSVNVNAQVEMGANFTADVGLNSVISYSNGQYSSSFNVDPSSTIDFSNPSGQVKALVNLSLVPEFKIKLYRVVVPYVKPSAHLDITSTVASPSLNWDILGEGYAKLEYGIEDIVILGKNIASFEPNIFESEHVEYKTPFRVEIVSGNNQVGQPGQFLANPIVLRVKDSFSSTQRNVLVTVTVTLGNGSITQTNARTNAEGLVSINWKLGNQTTQAQQLTISVKNGSMEELTNSPININATFTPPLTLNTTFEPITSQAVWNTTSTTLRATGGVPPYQYCFFENCNQWSNDSTITYPANGIVTDSCGNQNFLYGGRYNMRVRDAAGTIASVLALVLRERAVVTTTNTICVRRTGTAQAPTSYGYQANFNISSPGACFNIKASQQIIYVHVVSSNIPGLYLVSGLDGFAGTSNNWNTIVNGIDTSNIYNSAGLKIPTNFNYTCINNFNTFVQFFADNTALSCPGATCSYRMQLQCPDASNAASPSRWIWSNVVTHTW